MFSSETLVGFKLPQFTKLLQITEQSKLSPPRRRRHQSLTNPESEVTKTTQIPSLFTAKHLELSFIKYSANFINIFMNHLQKLKIPFLLKWDSSNLLINCLRSSNIPPLLSIGPLYTAKAHFSYSSIAENTEKVQMPMGVESSNIHSVTRRHRSGKADANRRAEVQSVLLEYLHGTRSVPFMDAEHMSKNSPIFLEKLLRKVEGEEDIVRSLTRFFCYHPINEFEPFFESIGLKPSEFEPLLPREMFLNDADVLIENYHVLCNYGIHRSKMGKIYKEAMEVFSYDYGVLYSKLRSYEEHGFSQSSVIKLVVCCPTLLIGGVNAEFIKVIEELKSLEIEYHWIESRLSERNSYNWSRILGFLSCICQMGCSEKELVALIRRHPVLLFDGSAKNAHLMIGLLRKLGCTEEEIYSMFMQLPRVQLGTFVKNLRQGLLFLMSIEMDAEDIGTIVRANIIMLGSCSLKKPNSVLTYLNVGKKRLCGIIKEDPQRLKDWVLGSKVDALPPDSRDAGKSLMQKTKFLLNLGFVENSDEMKKAFKVFRGKADELQDRFDCFVRAGLDPKDVYAMIKGSPQVINQSRIVIEKKIDYLVNELGYPVSSLVMFPSFISYTTDRVKLRFTMYEWLKNEGAAAPMLALSTILACSDKTFVKQLVQRHPKGLEVWEELKKQIICSA